MRHVYDTVSKNKSAIWVYFTIKLDVHFAECNICKTKVSRGGKSSKTFNTTNIVNHLKVKHVEEYKKYEEEKATEVVTSELQEASKKQQFKLEECGGSVKKWGINSPCALKVTRKTDEMIALDNHPFSIVEDIGFRQLMQQLEPCYSVPSRNYITEVVIPRIVVGLTNEVQKLLKEVVWFSFTTDVWSTDVSSDSLLSLTAHWLSDLFERQSAVLYAEPIHGSHTCELLCEHYKRMLAKWKIKESQVHLMVRDNAANMVKAMTDGSFSDLGCFAHTLRLIVHDGVLSQKIITDTLASARCIVNHYKCSPLAYGQLKEIQENLQLPVHHLKRDEPTCWNSSLYMLCKYLLSRRWHWLPMLVNIVILCHLHRFS